MLLIIFILFKPVLCQNLNSQSDFENVLFDDTVDRLKQIILHSSRKQAIYAYNIANATTPEFTPVLPREDQRLLVRTFPDGNYTRDALLELVLTKMTENRSRYNAYINLQKKKFEIIKQVSTLGKK